MADLQAGSYGVAIVVALQDGDGMPLDLTLATAVRLELRRSWIEGDTEVTPDFVTPPGSDGVVRHILPDGFLDQTGRLQVQGIITYATKRLRTAVETIFVLAGL
jgi:hypothetical protein